MKKTLTLIRYLFKNLWCDWEKRVFVFFIPLGIIICISYYLGNLELNKLLVKPFTVGMVNLDQTFETRTMIQQFSNSQELKNLVTMVETDEQSAIPELKDNKFAAVIIIPKGFSHDLSIGKNTPIKVLGNRQRPLESMLVKSVMQSTANFVTAAESGVNTIYNYLCQAGVSNNVLANEVRNAIFMFSLNSLGRQGFFHEQQIDDPAIIAPIQYYLYLGIIMLSEIWALMLISFSQDNINNLLEKRLIIKGFKPENFVIATIIELTLTVFLQAILVLIVFSFALQIDNNSRIYFAFACVALAVGSFFTFLGAVFTNSNLRIISGLSLILIFAFLAGGFVPLSYLPPVINKISVFSINKWGFDLIRSASSDGFSLASAAELIGMSALCYLAAIFVQKRRMALE